jgi:2-polyprenyl-6-methoxyphenol hydroxylase-like FAD-dependent oxidoreductase
VLVGQRHELAQGPPAPEQRRQRILDAHAGDPAWIAEVIGNTPEILGPWQLHEIATMPRWHRGRACLIGDAAHACSPSAGQGASLAMEDAMLLARCLRDDREPESAFATFVSLRRARVERIVRQSRRNGSPKVPASRFGAWMRDRMLPLFLKLGASAIDAQCRYRIDWSAGAQS